MKYVLNGSAVKNPAEDLLVCLFPSDPPEQVDTIGEEEDGMIISLRPCLSTICAETKFIYGGKHYYGRSRVPFSKGDDRSARDASYEAVKTAMYRAAQDAGCAHEKWGALTGVHPSVVFEKEFRRTGGSERARQAMTHRYFVHPEKTALLAEIHAVQEETMLSVPDRAVGVYISIPFCPTRCSYCSFVSTPAGSDGDLIGPYLDALCREITEKAAILKEHNVPVASLYIGGGTPTILDEGRLERLLGHIRDVFDLSACEEWTVEGGRPDTLTEKKLHICEIAGVTRFCVNPQSMKDETLERIGRRHSADETRKWMAKVKETGMILNTDLIYGLPGETKADTEDSAREIMRDFRPENLTIHSLAVKKGSLLKEEDFAKNLQNTDEGALESLYNEIRGNGYSPYYLYRQKYARGGTENTGWALKGDACIYNIQTMTERSNIIACGAGGSTKLLLPGGKAQRVYNPKYPKEYLEQQDPESRDKMIRDYFGGTAYEDHTDR